MVPRSPQQNGVVERKNRSIINMVRIMFKIKKMPKKFWVKAINYDKCPTKGLNDMTS
jgi:hypothetical protein